MRRPVVTEIIGWFIFLGCVWVFIGGPIPGWNRSDPVPAPGPTSVAIAEPTASTAAAVIEPAASHAAAVAEPAVGVTSQIARTGDGGDSLSAAQPAVAPPSPWASIPIIVLLIILLAVTVFCIGVGVIAIFLWRHRRPRLVTPEGIEIEVEDRRSPAPTPRPYQAPAAAPQVTRPALPALPSASTVVHQPWRFLAAPETLAALRALGQTPTPDQRLPDPDRRILELQARFRATEAIIAPDRSVVVFPNVALPLERIRQIASPQPAVLSGDGTQPLCIVGLWHPGVIEITSTQTRIGEPERAASPPANITRVERTTQLIPAIPRQVPFPGVQQTAMLPQGTLPILLAIQESQLTWISRSLLHSGHWSIAGKSQRGKGNFIRYALLSVLMLPPEQVQAIIIDLKGGADFGFALKLAHARLYTPRDTDGACIGDGDLADGLSTALKEMARRNRLFIETGVRNIWQYNEKFPDQRLPSMVVVVDEAHDLPRDLMERLHALVSRSLSAGIVVFVTTQHPANVIPTNIRGNYSTYLAFKVEGGRHFVEAALGLAQGGDSLYDPSAIPDTLPGTAVLRFDGQEHFGRVPEITDDLQHTLTQRLIERFPRPTPEVGLHTEQPAPVLAASSQVVEGAAPIDLTKMTAADFVQALNDPTSPAGAAVQQWLLSIQALPAGTSRPEDTTEPVPQLRPYDLIADDSPHKISLKQCVSHPIVVKTVLRVYNDLKTRLGFQELSGHKITDAVFERVAGSNDGWTSTRWTQVVKPILATYDLPLPTRDGVSETETGPGEGTTSVQLAA
ncbi:MAG TPA: FtsK/SpoIIIE domain-containing protein [Herpetosiphonaceae bacterium]